MMSTKPAFCRQEIEAGSLRHKLHQLRHRPFSVPLRAASQDVAALT